MKNYKLFYVQNNTKQIIEIVYINTTIRKIKKDFQERINFDGRNYIHYGTEEF